jgi:hypothetical protein
MWRKAYARAATSARARAELRDNECTDPMVRKGGIRLGSHSRGDPRNTTIMTTLKGKHITDWRTVD